MDSESPVTLGCTDSQCRYQPHVVRDVDDDGNVWPGSPFDHHLEACPSQPGWVAATLCPTCRRPHTAPHTDWCNTVRAELAAFAPTPSNPLQERDLSA